MTTPGSPAALETLDVTQSGFYLRPDYEALLAWLRANDPVHRSAASGGQGGMVLVSRYDDIREISRQPERFSSRSGALINDPVRMSGPNDAAASLLHLDPPMHADYRKLLNREFTPRAVARMEVAVRRAVTDAFDALDARWADGDEAPDLVEHVASPVPLAVIADLLGMTDYDPATLRRWSDAAIDVMDDPTGEVLAALVDFGRFLDGHVRQRFESPDTSAGGDLLSLLAASTVGDQRLTPAQVQMFCITLVVAGNETTRALISGGALALAQHPDQRAILAAAIAADAADQAEDAVGRAVEEMLRWTTPIQAFCRTAMADATVGEGTGSSVAAGDYLVMLYASGNRDESVFGPTAASFDVTRAPTPAHVAFGFGEHLCLGAALARLEARLVVEELLRRHPSYEVAGEPRYVPSTLTKSLATLPVRLG
jgi:cytochrome P450